MQSSGLRMLENLLIFYFTINGYYPYLYPSVFMMGMVVCKSLQLQKEVSFNNFR